jgi:hypothetical protein
LVYFKDKGADALKLNKLSKVYLEAEKLLTAESVERRKQVMGDEYITYDDLPVNEEYVKTIESTGVIIIHKLKWFNAVSCYLNDEQKSKIQFLPFVKSIEPVRTFKKSEPVEGSLIPQAQLYKTNFLLDYGASFTQNNLSDIPVVHDLGIIGGNVIVGLLDTGFRWKTQPSLQGRNVLAERDFIQGDNTTSNETGDASNQDSHGTNVFSIIGGYAPGNLIGPAFGAKFLLAKTEDVRSEKNIEEDNYAAALEWMESLGVHITSSSLGYSTFDNGQTSYSFQQMDGKSTIVARAVNLAFERGVSTFTSAGNEGANYWGSGVSGIQSPADARDIIAVGAVTSSNVVSSFSSRGPTSDGRIKPEIVAQGLSVVFGNAAGSYSYGNGTSYSAPIAAGISALLKSAFPHLTNKQIRQIMLESGDNVNSPNNERGYGLISAKRAAAYPNISFVNGQPVINKSFIMNGGINEGTLRIFIRESNQNFEQAYMIKRNSYSYTYTVPSSLADKNIEFYFTYQGNDGVTYREPSVNNYRFKYGSWAVDNVLTSIKENEEVPLQFSLMQNYPNPFNPGTTIKFTIPNIKWSNASNLQHVSLKVFDFLGREITTLVDEYKMPGSYSITFNSNNKLASGILFYQLKAGDYISTKKMMLLK